MKRVDALKRIAFEKKGFGGFLVTNEANLLYLTRFLGAACLWIPKSGESTIYVFSVNYEQAKTEGKRFKVKLVERHEDFFKEIVDQVKTYKINKIAVDTLNPEYHRVLAKALKGKAKLRFQGKLVWELRKVKDEKELELMRKAAELTSEGMTVAYETTKPGIREYEVAAEIEYAMRRKGSWGTAFDTIVASGARSAFPHGGCTDRKILKGDLVVVDIGATYHYYQSDMTRTIVAGKPSTMQKKIYELVRLAQEKAFQAVKPKTRVRDIDAIAREVIEGAGYGEYFVHRLGHGVGLEVHEPPTLGQDSKDRLFVGNVVTIEPGIYIVGFGGIRIEDTVLVRKRKGEKLTKEPYALETKP